MPGDPILTKIEDEMYSLIGGMTKGAYHFNWGSVNELDLAKQMFPSAVIYLDSEDTKDFDNPIGANEYDQTCVFSIHVMAELETECENPVYAINKELNKALDDLKKLFGRRWNLNGQADIIMYIDSRRETTKNGDIILPKKLITRWRVDYEQDRTNPDIVAGA